MAHSVLFLEFILKTKQSYQWIDDSPLDVHIEDLPCVTLKQVKNIITQSEMLLRNHVVQKVVRISNYKGIYK